MQSPLNERARENRFKHLYNLPQPSNSDSTNSQHQSSLPNASQPPDATSSNQINSTPNGATPHLDSHRNNSNPRPSQSPRGNTPQAPEATVSNSADITPSRPTNPQSNPESSSNVPQTQHISDTAENPLNGTKSSQLNTNSIHLPASLSQPPIVNSNSPAEVGGAASVLTPGNGDLIQWTTPPNRRNTPNPRCTPNLRYQRMHPSSPNPSSIPVTSLKGNRPDCDPVIPSSLPGLDPDVPNHNEENDDTSSHHSRGSPSALHTMQENQIAIIELLRTHSMKFSVLQDNIASTLRHQQEIKEKLEILSELMLHSRPGPGRPTRTNPTETNAPVLQAIPCTGRLKAELPPSPPTTSEKTKWRAHMDDDSL
ncbi:hypothetical protein PTTG_02338, partial [Puccinia triticina 1-1 BBBD Race 1]